MQQAGAYSAENVIKKEPLRPPYLFNDTAEHPKGKHVEQNVLPSGMHEHVGEELVKVKIGCQEEMQSQHIVQVKVEGALDDQRGKESQQVDNQQILGDGRNVL